MVRTGFKESDWKLKDIPNSQVIEYEMNVPVHGKKKKMIITLGYNTFEQRAEPTAEEKKSVSLQILRDARTSYWPTSAQAGKVYPTYFLQEQFDAADILLSKQCGDFGSLQILRDARTSYWPTPAQAGKVYPTYFLQEQFDAADILLSKQCGDFGLLQFDYL